MVAKLSHQPGTPPEPGLRLSYEEFLEAEFDHNHYEWVEGEVYETSAVEVEHARLTRWLLIVLTTFVSRRKLGEVFADPFKMHLPDLDRGRQPDLFFVRQDRLHLVKKQYLDGPADLVVEVVSRGSRTLDRRDKFREYEQAGVKEYWILDPLRKRAEFYQLDAGSFVPAEGENDRYESRELPGVWFEADWFWTQPEPDAVYKHWKLI